MYKDCKLGFSQIPYFLHLGWEVHVVHMVLEKNFVLDALAHGGFSFPFGVRHLSQPPEEVKAWLLYDYMVLLIRTFVLTNFS